MVTYSISVNFQHHTPLEAGADIVRRAQRRQPVPRISHNEHRTPRRDLKVAPVALLGLKLPLRAGNVDAAGYAVQHPAHTRQPPQRGHQGFEAARARRAIAAVDADQGQLRGNARVEVLTWYLAFKVEYADEKVDVVLVVVVLVAYENVERLGEVRPRHVFVETGHDQEADNSAVDDVVGDDDGVVLEALEELPYRPLERRGRDPVAGQRAPGRVRDAVLKDVREFLIRVGPFFYIPKFSVSKVQAPV